MKLYERSKYKTLIIYWEVTNWFKPIMLGYNDSWILCSSPNIEYSTSNSVSKCRERKIKCKVLFMQ